jgi:hypothetical protein
MVEEISMTDDELQPYESEEAEREQPSPRPEPVSFDAYRSIVRLLIGLALAGGDDLVGRLREWESAHPPESIELGGEPETESASDLARRALIGMVFEAAETARQVAWGAAGLSVSFAGALWSAFRPVADSFLFRPLWAPIRAVATRGEARLERYTRTGRDEEQRSRKLAGEVTGLLIEDVVNYVGDNPGVKALVDAQVERLLPGLVTDATIQALLVEQLGVWIAGLATRPESLDPLVREVGDRYIAYLNDHPDDVQNLVQGQAVGMAAEVRDNVRTVTVTGDTFLETLVRALLRRAPREDLPPPSPEVQQWADMRRRVDVSSSPKDGKDG